MIFLNWFMFITVVLARFILLFTISKFSFDSTMLFLILPFLPKLDQFTLTLFCCPGISSLLSTHKTNTNIRIFTNAPEVWRTSLWTSSSDSKAEFVRCYFFLPFFTVFCMLLLPCVYMFLPIVCLFNFFFFFSFVWSISAQVLHLFLPQLWPLAYRMVWNVVRVRRFSWIYLQFQVRLILIRYTLPKYALLFFTGCNSLLRF